MLKQIKHPVPIAHGQPDNLFTLNHRLRFFERRLHQKLINRRTAQFGCFAKGFVNIVRDARINTILLGNNGSNVCPPVLD